MENELSDEQLVKSASNGDEKAFNKLVTRYDSIIKNIAYDIVNDYYIAQEIAQEVFMKAYKNLEKIQKPEKIGNWLCTVTKRASIDYLRKKKPLYVNVNDLNEEKNYFSESINLEENIIAKESTKKLWMILNSLSRANRLTSILYFVGDYTAREIADFLELNIKTIESRIYRAKKKIRDKFYTTTSEENNKIKYNYYKKDILSKTKYLNNQIKKIAPPWLQDLEKLATKKYRKLWLNIYEQIPNISDKKTVNKKVTKFGPFNLNEFSNQLTKKIKKVLYWMWLSYVLRIYNNDYWKEDFNDLAFGFKKEEDNVIYTIANFKVNCGHPNRYLDKRLLYFKEKTDYNKNWAGINALKTLNNIVGEIPEINKLKTNFDKILKLFNVNTPEPLISLLQSEILKRFEKIYNNLTPEFKNKLDSGIVMDITYLSNSSKEIMREIVEFNFLYDKIKRLATIPVWVRETDDIKILFFKYSTSTGMGVRVGILEENKWGGEKERIVSMAKK